jgi:hypothetical protein
MNGIKFFFIKFAFFLNYKCEAITILIVFYVVWFFIESDYNKFLEQRDDNLKPINLSYINNLKKLVYTVNFGNYDTIKKIDKQKGYDYFIFMDKYKTKLHNSNWTKIPMPKIVKNLNISIIKKQRFIKTHPELFFPNYDLSIYIDGIFTIKGNLDEFLLRILTPSLSIYTLEHPDRNTINQELLAVEKLKKDNKRNIIRIRNRYTYITCITFLLIIKFLR